MTMFSDSSRFLLSVAGDEREHFLQGILTQDVAQLTERKIQFSALLSPQG
jgi:folate-binding Fe-S cluster repair protein YgfZ